MFLSEKDEKRFFDVLAAYEGEFGAAKLVIILSTEWMKKLDLTIFQPIKIKSWNYPKIGLRVVGISANYEQELINTEEDAKIE